MEAFNCDSWVSEFPCERESAQWGLKDKRTYVPVSHAPVCPSAWLTALKRQWQWWIGGTNSRSAWFSKEGRHLSFILLFLVFPFLSLKHATIFLFSPSITTPPRSLALSLWLRKRSMCVHWILTPGVAERRFSGLASIAALVRVEGCALLPAASHHLHVPAEIFRFSQSLQAVQFPAAGIRQVEWLARGIHRQVVLMSRTRAGEREF